MLAGVPGADVSIYSEVLSRFEVAGVTGFLDRDGFSRPAALRWTMIGVDLLVVMATVALVSGRTFQPSVAMGAGLLAGLALVAVVTLRGGYRHRQWDVPGRDLRVLVSAIGIPAAVAISLSYFRIVSIPPELLLRVIVATVAGAGVMHGVHHLLLRRMRRRESWQRRALLVGPGQDLEDLHRMLRRGCGDVVIVGTCALDGLTGRDDVLAGELAEAPVLARRLGADTVVVSANGIDAQELQQLGWRLEPLGVTLLVVPAIREVDRHRASLVTVDGAPMVRIGLGPSRGTMTIKALMDRGLGVVLGLVGLVVLLPAMLAIKTTSPGPVLFRQRRIGLDGLPFTIFKLRTMHVDAEQRLAHLLEGSDGNEVQFKMHQDPRVTPVGRILRRFSIDELPQLWNVIRGDMSLVGPRPHSASEVENYDDPALHRLAAKPGLTGLWQVSGRSDLDWAESVRLDLRYVDNRNIRTDIEILARTAGAVLGGRGAY